MEARELAAYVRCIVEIDFIDGQQVVAELLLVDEGSHPDDVFYEVHEVKRWGDFVLPKGVDPCGVFGASSKSIKAIRSVSR